MILTDIVLIQDKLCRNEITIEELQKENMLIKQINVLTIELSKQILENENMIKKLQVIQNALVDKLKVVRKENIILMPGEKYRNKFVMYPWNNPDDDGPRPAAWINKKEGVKNAIRNWRKG